MEMFGKLASADALEKQQETVEKIRAEEARVLEDDAIYVKVDSYITEILRARAGDEANKDGEGDSSTRWHDGQTYSALGESVSSLYAQVDVDDVNEEEDRIHRRGDLPLKDTPSKYQPVYSPLYVMKWSHIAVYDGNYFMYDAHPNDCHGTDDNGVGLRLVSRMYVRSEAVQYAELSSQSWRRTLPDAVDDAKDDYGDNCTAPFTKNPFNMSSTSKFYCSQLVWKVYLDNDDYSVNLDSNDSTYHFWLQDRMSD